MHIKIPATLTLALSLALSLSLGLGCATTTASSSSSSSCTCKGKLHAEGYLPLGKTKVWPLSDGELQLKPAWFQGVPPEEKLKALGVETEESALPTSLNAFLVESEEQRILIDAGLGAFPGMGPNMGQLTSALAARNMALESINAVLITHMHGDHVAGLLNDDMAKPRFPNATVWVHEAELAFWTQNPERIPEAQRADFVQGHEGAKLLVKTLGDKLKTFAEAEQVLFPGVKALHAPGHTPGHAVFMLESEGKKLLVWGDLIHNIRLQTAFPKAYPFFDAEPTAAVATRLHWMEKAASEGFWVAGMHLPYPGIGRLEKQTGESFGFVPIEKK
jgi:glyoxylase-like metal-dependent hydrolase (beta-lactamase superfamily II)